MSTAIELASRIRYQLAPGVHTFGPCERGCGRMARGSESCAHCLTRELSTLVGEALAYDWLRAVRRSSDLLARIEEAGQ